MSIENPLIVRFSLFDWGSLFRLIDCTLFLVYEVALGTTSLLQPYLARTVLDWRPSKPGFIDGLPIYYAAWKAAQ
jgi:hypothetical protein